MKTVTRRLLFLICAAPFLLAQPSESSGAPALEGWLGPFAAFWTWGPDQFERETRSAGFRWMEAGVSARAAPLRGTVFGKPVYESVVRFQDGTPQSVL